MKKLKMFSLGIALLISFLAFSRIPEREAAGERTITGVVSDASGSIPGANVILRGTTTGTQTDIEGKYTIKAKKGDVLEFSFIGMNTEIVTVGNANVINVTLQESAQLQEVVVTALGVKRKRQEVSYSRQFVKSSELTQSGSPKTARALVAKEAGLRDSDSEATKQETHVGVYDGRHPNRDNQALVIIDGKIATMEELKNISADEISTTDILKGDKAAALYGSQGVNGVIIVQTKKSNYNTAVPNEEDYDSLIENPFENPRMAALSTFSIDVDNASYTNIRRFINQGEKVPKDAVRIEEMVNFFKYNYPQPKDENPFSINTEYSDCPWNKDHRLLKIGLQGKNIPTNDLPASNLVFLIDVSGSMAAENKLPLLQQSLKILVNELRQQDKVSIVVYAGAAGMVLPPTSGSDSKTILAALDELTAGGSTAGGQGIELAYKIASANFIRGGNNRVILATDGDFNVGESSNSDMEKLIENKRKSGVFLTCLGYGMGNYKDSKMEILADKGNGNYAYIDNIQEASRFLGREFKGSMYAIAKDVKIQIEFNPKQVQSYRLIGYENRKLRPEDFVNDAVDAGELGSGHSVTALYEVIPSGVKSSFSEVIPILKYSKVEETENGTGDELATVKFRYKKPDGNKSIEMVQAIQNNVLGLQSASDDFKFSASVAWFGLKLRDSKLVPNKLPEDITKLAKQGMAHDEQGYKAEFIRLVESATTI
jgi:Ca-activated chloride channel family protein